MEISNIADLIRGHKFLHDTELHLQDGLERLFLYKSIPFKREYQLSKKDRPDFMVDGIAVECKIEESPASVYRQLSRYAQHDEVAGLILVTTRYKHRVQPGTINNKPLCVVHLFNL